jgi:hypothetical protein
MLRCILVSRTQEHTITNNNGDVAESVVEDDDDELTEKSE